MFKKIASGIMCMALALMAGCGTAEDNNVSGAENGADMAQSGSQNAGNNEGNNTAKGSVYYLNFKPEVDEVWQRLAKEYTNETGVQVKVVTAANNTYEQTLMSEIAKKEPPTLFQINGPVGYQNWKDYCADLSDTNLYEWLLDESMTVTGEDGGVYGIAYVVEGYGIIYNNAIMDRYFALSGAKAASMDDIKNFQTLKAVVEDMQARKSELGIQGVFASTSLNPGDDWRWQTHLANIPVYYEMRDKGVADLETLAFTYAENFKNIFDLYIDNSCTAPGLLGSKSVDDSMAEFALGKAAMVQNGNWAWAQISGIEGNTVAEEDVKFLPIYTGIDGEEAQGLCVGTENFIAVNSQVSAENQAASIAFLEWLFSSEKGRNIVINELEFISPFNTFGEDEMPADPLAREVVRYMNDETKNSIPWNFTSFPSQQFKDDFGAALLEYSAGSMSWEDLKNRVTERWSVEKGLN